MSMFMYDGDIAAKVGANAATVYHHILFWCNTNKANNKNYEDGNWWTFNSMQAFSKLIPHLSPKSIRTSLKALEGAGLIVIGEFNKDGRDRTNWYAIPSLAEEQKSVPDRKEHLPKRANAFAQTGTPLPDSKHTDISLEPDKLALSSKTGTDALREEVVRIPLIDNSEYIVYKDYADELQKCYPVVDVKRELLRMRGWSISNPTRRKTKSGVRRFIAKWLDGEQNRAHPAEASRPMSNIDRIIAEAEEKKRELRGNGEIF